MLLRKIKGGEEGIEAVKQQVKLFKRYLDYINKQKRAKKKAHAYMQWIDEQNAQCPLCTYREEKVSNVCPVFHCASDDTPIELQLNYDWCFNYIPTGEITRYGSVGRLRLKYRVKWFQSALKDFKDLLKRTRKERKWTPCW